MTNMYEDSDPRKSKNVVTHQFSSRAWYLLPIFLSIIGGVISYTVLKKKDPIRARKTFALGAILFALFMLFIIGVVIYGDQDIDILKSSSTNVQVPESKSVPYNMSAKDIRENAITVPYDLLVKYSDVYAGDIIHYTGYVVGVQEDRNGDPYALKIEMYDTDDSVFVHEKIIWSNYKPQTHEQRELIEHLDKNSGLITLPNSDNAVDVWAISKGVRLFDTVINKYHIPETDIVMLKMIAATGIADPSENKNQKTTTHTISYGEIPDYVDSQTVREALEQAVQAWESVNPSASFKFVADDADLNVEWSKWLPKGRIGSYASHNETVNDKIVTKHRINILLGSNDCNSNYQQYSHDALKHTMAHEIGHYLGLRHIDEADNLMHSGVFLDDADNIFTHNNRGYNIPEITRAEYQFMVTEVILEENKMLGQKLAVAVQEREKILDSNNPDTFALDSNKEEINSLTRQIADLDKQAMCVGETAGELDKLLKLLAP